MPSLNRRFVEHSPYTFESSIIDCCERVRVNMDIVTGDEELRCRIVVSGQAYSFDVIEHMMNLYRTEGHFWAQVAGHPMKFVMTRGLEIPWPPHDLRFSFEAISIWFEPPTVHPVILLRRQQAIDGKIRKLR